MLLWATARINLDFIYRSAYPPYRVIQEVDTPYGNHKLLEREGQLQVVTQGNIIATIPDALTAERDVLVPLLAHPTPRSLLLIGGNVSGYGKYLSQFPALRRIVYLEKDPYLMQLQKDLLSGDQSRPGTEVDMIREDVRSHLRGNSRPYDVICVNTGEPYTLSDNRYYTREFFTLLHRNLTPGGLIFFSVRSSENYLGPALARYIQLLHRTLQTVFQQVLIIPGDENLFLASDSMDFCQQYPSMDTATGEAGDRAIVPDRCVLGIPPFAATAIPIFIAAGKSGGQWCQPGF